MSTGMRPLGGREVDQARMEYPSDLTWAIIWDIPVESKGGEGGGSRAACRPSNGVVR